MKRHYNVFGVNVTTPDDFQKLSIFGDEQMKLEWYSEHETPNCAESEWKLFCAISEFNFIFVNADTESKFYGATRIITNNCFEDLPLTNAPFSNFQNLLVEYCSQYSGDTEETFHSFLRHHSANV